MRSLASQGHLCPISGEVTLVNWEFDQSLWLYPLPNSVIVCDQSSPFFEKYADCRFVNPGPFHKQMSFKVYYPGTGVVEDSQISVNVEDGIEKASTAA